MNTDLVPTYDDLLHSQIVIDNIEKQDSTLNHIQLHIHTKYVIIIIIYLELAYQLVLL